MNCSDSNNKLILRQPIKDNYSISCLVHEFEKRYNAYVYHAIQDAMSLIILFISHNEGAWKMLRPVPECREIYAATINILTNNIEFGPILLKELCGTLVRVDPFLLE